MFKPLFFIVSLVIVTSGCSIYQVDSQDISADIYPSKPTAKDVAYLESVNRPHEVIGHVKVNTERRQRISDVLEKMKREAAILGGDAITNVQTDATGMWKSLPAQELIGNGYIRASFTADIIVFK